MNRLLACVLWTGLTLFHLPSVLAQESGWPRTVPLEQGMVTIYALQVDDKSENTIQFRAALAFRETAGAEPVFGAGWFESEVDIDTAKRIVHPIDLKLVDTRFPDGTDNVQTQLSDALVLESPHWNLDFSLDELEGALKTAETESMAVNTAPPNIVYRDQPALLLSIDGDPVLREIKDSPYKAVINTPYPLIFDGSYYYLNAAKDVWYRARKAIGPYQFEAGPPAAIKAMVNADESETSEVAESQPSEPITRSNAPEIVVSTEPTELIVTEGPAAFVPLVEDLLVLQNSDDDVFMHVSSQKFYIVLSGRWYQASSLNGPWDYAPADNLPAAFANIPRDSNQADSRVYVAGTEEARDAVLDAYVPQTAAVARGEADIDVKYDGEPVFEPVDGTDLVYIQNTGSTVLQANGLYYLVENGVWYVSSSTNGPWQVSDHRPEQVDTILPTSPVHNVKYVHVYDSTPSVVYVGYTPGYTGSYVYRNTVFYGSGWNYRPWVSPYYYYPRHSTWGFNVNYNSWSGWNFGLSWGWGPFNVSYYSGGYWHQNQYWHHRHYGRWGPGRYRSRPAHYGHGRDRYGHNNYAYNNRGRNDYGRGGSRRNDSGHNNDGRGGNNRGGGNGNDYGSAGNGNRGSNTGRRNDNLYNDASQRARVARTRDNRRQEPARRSQSGRQANYIAGSNTRQINSVGSKKSTRSRTGPVSSSDLRMKANLRDANFEAGKSRLLADNSGKVYNGTSRSRQRNDVVSRQSTSGKKSKNRITPSTPARQQNLSVSRNRSASKSSKERSGRSNNGTATRTSQTTRTTRRVASAPATSTRQTSTRQTQTKKNRNSDRARLSPTSSTPVRSLGSKSSGKSTVQRSSRTVSAPKSPQSRSRTVSQPRTVVRTNSRSQKRVAPAPVQRQSTKRATSQPKTSANRNNSRSAPVQSGGNRTTQKSTNKGRNNKSKSSKSSAKGSKSSGTKQTASRRSRDK